MSDGAGGVGFIVRRGFYVGLAGLAIGYDWWTKNRVHPVYWVAVGVLILDDAVALVRPTDAWTDFTAQIAAALESVLLSLM